MIILTYVQFVNEIKMFILSTQFNDYTYIYICMRYRYT